MRFARAIWKLLVGVKDALVLIFMLMFFGLLYAGLSAKPTPVGDGVLALDLNGAVVEQPSRAELSEALAGGSQAQDYRLRDLLAVLKTLVGDWTNGDPEITRFLESRGRAGVPLYLWYEPGKEPEELPQVLTPSMLTDRARRQRL